MAGNVVKGWTIMNMRAEKLTSSGVAPWTYAQTSVLIVTRDWTIMELARAVRHMMRVLLY